MKIHIVYFSATYTTRTVCRGVAECIGGEVVEHDVTDSAPVRTVDIPREDLLVIGTPVYCGRVPEMAAERYKMFRGDNTRAVTLAVYGNREFDDALLELTRIVRDNGFKTVASAAFIGRHCIFPNVATMRPDDKDKEKMKEFADLCRPVINAGADAVKDIVLPGNDEYCPHKRVPFCPVPTANCSNCGTCAELCPTGAISLEDASKVNTELCITCGRCVMVCPQGDRVFAEPMYPMAAANFEKANGARKEPVFFFAEVK